jgi:Iron-containing redox enzyme
MTSIFSAHRNSSEQALIEAQIENAIEVLMTSLPDPEHLSSEQRRGIIARYTAVLESNFIYWMTGAYLSSQSEEARHVILENLTEEVRDSHPAMLRRFTLAAHAMPTDSDVMAVHQDLTNVRLFVGRLSQVRIILMMTFFEGLIQRFMGFLARLATLDGSAEQEYTDVHGVCDVTHTRELLRALAAEIALAPPESSANLFEGVELLSALIRTIVFGAESGAQADVARAGGSLVAG